jgi:ATP-dependent Clp protease adaptor protein ClpS
MTVETTPTIEVETEEQIDVTEPNLWNVLLHNDDKTTMQFVVAVLVEIFHRSVQEATQIMLDVHNNGRGIAGTYTYEIAEEKMDASTHAARANGFPLKVTIEEQK